MLWCWLMKNEFVAYAILVWQLMKRKMRSKMKSKVRTRHSDLLLSLKCAHESVATVFRYEMKAMLL